MNLKSMMTLVALILVASPMFAQGGNNGGGIVENSKAFAALALGLAAFGGALGQGRVGAAVMEAIGRNPSASGRLLVPMLLGLAFIESLVLFTFVVVNGIAG